MKCSRRDTPPGPGINRPGIGYPYVGENVAMPQRALVLGQEGKRIVFPDEESFCLVCGEESAGTRRVWFEALDAPPIIPGTMAGRMAGLGGGIAAIVGRVTFDAPLCREHRKHARLLSLKTTGLAV